MPVGPHHCQPMPHPGPAPRAGSDRAIKARRRPSQGSWQREAEPEHTGRSDGGAGRAEEGEGTRGRSEGPGSKGRPPGAEMGGRREAAEKPRLVSPSTEVTPAT